MERQFYLKGKSTTNFWLHKASLKIIALHHKSTLPKYYPSPKIFLSDFVLSDIKLILLRTEGKRHFIFSCFLKFKKSTMIIFLLIHIQVSNTTKIHSKLQDMQRSTVYNIQLKIKILKYILVFQYAEAIDS